MSKITEALEDIPRIDTIEVTANAAAPQSSTYTKTEIDNTVTSLPKDVITNGIVDSGVLALNSVETTGSIPILYTGDGTSQDATTPMQIANDDGDGTTLAVDWVSGSSYTLNDIYIDNSTTGDALAYELTSTDTTNTVSPILNSNWTLVTNQYGGRFHFKNRDTTQSSYIIDSVRRDQNCIFSDLTTAETNSANYPSISSTTSVSTGTTVSQNTDDYVLWVDQTTRKTPGYRTDAGVIQNSKNNTGTDLMVKDGLGNPIIEHYNPSTGFSIIIRTSHSGAIVNIPHSLQKKPATFTSKSLDNTRDWITYNKISGATHYTALNNTIAATDDATMFNDTEPTDSSISFGTHVHVSENVYQYITYLQADSDNHVIKSYNGSGAIGNIVDLGLDMTVPGSWGMLKILIGTTASWVIVDNVRGDNQYLLMDTSSIESSSSGSIEFTTTGIIINETGNTYNALSYVYLIHAYSPKYQNPTDGNLVGVNTSKDLTYTQGVGVANITETTGAHTVDCSSFAGTTAYILKEHGSNAKLSVNKFMYAQERGSIVGAFLNTLTKSIDSKSFVSRASTATYIDSYGVLQYAEIDEPRFEVDDLLIEGGSTNLLIQSNFLSDWSDGSSTTNTDNSTEILSVDGISPTTKVVRFGTGGLVKRKVGAGILNGETHTHSVYVYMPSGTDDLIFDIDYDNRDSSSVVTYTEKDKWIRCSVTLTATADVTNIDFNINAGSTDTYYISFAQSEELPFASSYIPTTTTAVTRSIDVSETFSTNLVALGEVKVDSQGNTFDLVEYNPLQSYFNDLTVAGEANLRGNVKIVDFGTVYKNKRYVIDNPFGNENYKGCFAFAELFIDGEWHDSGWGNHTAVTSAYGTKGFVKADGVTVQTGSSAIHHNNASYTGASHGSSSSFTTAQCRVIVIKIGEASDA